MIQSTKKGWKDARTDTMDDIFRERAVSPRAQG